ncbi:MAG: DUF4124 domain-containing protein [Thalassotalea sp.]
MENLLLSRLILPLSVMLVSFTSIAQDIVYRWVDENNVVHFSQHQPSHDNYTTLSVSGNSKKRDNNKPAEDANQAAEKSSEEEKKSTIETVMNKRCEEVKANKETLTSFEKVQFKSADGELTLLSDEEKTQQIAIADKQIEVYCK